MIYELIGLIVCIIVIFCVVYIKIWELKQIDIAEKQIENMERIDSTIAQQDYQLLSLAGGLSQFEVNNSNFAGKNPLHPLKVQAL